MIALRRRYLKRGRLDEQRLVSDWVQMRWSMVPFGSVVTPIMRMGRIPFFGYRREKWHLPLFGGSR